MPRPTNALSRPRLQVLGLEDRNVPAVTASFAAGTLTINGDGADDGINVLLTAGKVEVRDGANATITVTGAPGTGITLASLTVGISIDAGGGIDAVDVAEAITKPTTILGGAGSDIINGGGGNDSINGGADNDIINGRKGNDTITDPSGDNILDGGAGNDTITGGSDVDQIYGNLGKDVITGGDGDDDLYGGFGSLTTTVDTDRDADTINGGIGNDTVRSGQGNDSVTGGDGDDFIDAGAGNDTVDAGSGNDQVDGGTGNDLLVGGPQADPTPATDNDQLFGDLGNDTLNAGWGDDLLYGEAGLDSLVGGAGQDTLSGGLGRDFFFGHGPGAVGSATDAANFDTYKDEFDFSKPINVKAEAADLAFTELNTSETLGALASIVNAPADFNLAGRIRYLGTGDYKVRLGDPASNNWVDVHFDGTWTDNDPMPNAGERSLPVTAPTERREFWALLFHRARMASIPGYSPDVYIDQATYNGLAGTSGQAVSDISGRGESVTLPSSPITFVGTNIPASFGTADITTLLKSPKWLTVRTAATPVGTTGLVGDQTYAIVGVVSSGVGVNKKTYLKLYNVSGFDKNSNLSTDFVDPTGAKKNDGFITVQDVDFYNATNIATAYVN